MGRKEEGFSGGGDAVVSAEATVAMVGASAPDDPAELFLNGVPHCEQNGAARSTSEPHCWHRSICNGPTDRPLVYYLALTVLKRAVEVSQCGKLREYSVYPPGLRSSSVCLMHGISHAKIQIREKAHQSGRTQARVLTGDESQWFC